MTAIEPFEIAIDPAAIEDLQDRLTRTRWPSASPGEGWLQGPPPEFLRSLTDHWRDGYDWKSRQDHLNSFDHFQTTISGLRTHFIHAPSPHEGATPVVLLHGWPGSFVEFLDVIEPLRNPTAFGGSADDALHIVVPSLPGYGFSETPRDLGVGIGQVADMVAELMTRLGYQQYVVNGTDWGAGIAMHMGATEHRERLLGVTLNLAFADPSKYDFEPSEEEQEFAQGQAFYMQADNGYAVIQATRPQAIGYGLDDSPVGQAAWIVDKFHSWVDSDAEVTDTIDRDRLLDNISLYWFTQTGTTSARFYFEAFGSLFTSIPEVPAPTAYTRAKDIFQISERQARTRFTDLRRYSVAPRGGHFLAFEQPQFFVEDLRASIASLA